MTTFYDFTANTIDGRPMSMEEFRGKTVVVTNTATRCPLVFQLRGLERLWRDYADRGVVVLGFPCNQFMNQEPDSNDQVESVCQDRYGITFPLFAKVDVNGPFAHPLWQWMTHEQPGRRGPAVRWNYTKFLISRDGRVLSRFAPTTAPERLRSAIDSALWS